ncbi:MAG: hypothetical protein KJ882_01285 [Proteobacteria bacterium]|nr:hypothetical protein [Pseudomonadota bacterium]
MGRWNYYPRYVSVGEKKEKAQKQLKKLLQKDPNITPVIIEGNTLAKTWWGKSLNHNLERYADYSNRIGRGRSYVRMGAVLDIKISSGRVDAIVQGTRTKPYNVTIQIKAIALSVWNRMKASGAKELDSLQDLLAGKFPKALGEIFMEKDNGLFPSPKEIEFDCSCPDWASMCKHVAATLYAVGARLDEDPGLFFKLRQVEMNDLISYVVKDRTSNLLKAAKKKTSRVIDDSGLSDIFGIDLETEAVEQIAAAAKPAKKKDTLKPEKKTAALKKTKATGKVIKLPVKASKSFNKNIGDAQATRIIRIVKRAKNGIDVSTLKKKTGIDDKKIRSTLYSALKKGTIERVGRGIYTGNQT